jgi:hypothetical protein
MTGLITILALASAAAWLSAEQPKTSYLQETPPLT